MVDVIDQTIIGTPYEPSGYDNLSKKVKEKMKVAFKREEVLFNFCVVRILGNLRYRLMFLATTMRKICTTTT